MKTLLLVIDMQNDFCKPEGALYVPGVEADTLRRIQADVFTEKALKHYREKRIDPRTKTVVYSDALDLEGVENIRSFVNGRLHDVYGIGTFLSNDVGVKLLNMVIKMFECKPRGGKEFWSVVKLSDVEGKHTGDPKEIALCRGLLRI